MKILQAFFNKGSHYEENGKKYVFVEAVTLKYNDGRWCDQWNNPVDIHRYLEPYVEPEPKKRKRSVRK